MSNQSTGVSFVNDHPVLTGLLLLVMMVPNGLCTALVARFLWSTFVVPLGMPAVDLLHAWGLCLTAGFFASRVGSDGGDEGTARTLVRSFYWPFVCLLGYLLVRVALAVFGPL